MLLQIGLMSAQSSSSMVASFQALFIMRTGAKKSVIYEHLLLSWLSGECPSVVSDENTGRHTCRYRGMEARGSILGASFFAYKNKKATVSLGAFWFSSRTKADNNSLILAASRRYLITLSALASTLGGIVRPICFAVFRFIMNSNLIGCSTGRSAGFAPFKILST